MRVMQLELRIGWILKPQVVSMATLFHVRNILVKMIFWTRIS